MHRRTDAHLTLGQLLKHSGLARASVLHYEKLGLLLPRARSPAGYRLYATPELERLQAIRRLRDAGLSLDEIGRLLGQPHARDERPGGDSAAAALLQGRLEALQQQQQQLRRQQRHLARLLATPELIAGTGLGSKTA
jgi:DNA-binding transcriptional MerR regulator